MNPFLNKPGRALACVWASRLGCMRKKIGILLLVTAAIAFALMLVGGEPLAILTTEVMGIPFIVLFFMIMMSSIIVVILLCKKDVHLDTTNRQIVISKRFWWYEVSKCCRPLADFNSIVIRHLCSSDENGIDYSGSVGVKPVDGGHVVWIKDFKANEDEISDEAYEYAKELQKMTGLPLRKS